MSIKSAIQTVKSEMDKAGIVPENGLGKDLFLFSSTLTPIVNVDLLVTNEEHQILLAWRDDPHTGTGWHIPGGCIRFMETAEERIQRTAQAELGTMVRYHAAPIQVFEIFSCGVREEITDQRERAHFITLAYECHLPVGVCWKNNKQAGEPGYLQWFETLPENLLEVQSCYRAKWGEISQKLWRKENYGQLEK